MSLTVLIVNGFTPSARGKRRYATFRRQVKAAVQRLPLVRAPMVLERNLTELDSFIMDPTEDDFPNLTPARRLDSVDFLFIDGDDQLVPWHPLTIDLCKLIRLCVVTDKFLFACGPAALLMATVCYQGLHRPLFVPDHYWEAPRGRDSGRLELDVLMARDTGAVFRFSSKKRRWLPTGAMGVQALAALRHRGDDVVRPCASFRGHYLFRGEDVLAQTPKIQGEWTVDSRTRKAYHVLARGRRSDHIIQAGEAIGLYFHLNTHDSRLLDKFVKHNYERMVVEGRVSKVLSRDMSVLGKLTAAVQHTSASLDEKQDFDDDDFDDDDDDDDEDDFFEVAEANDNKDEQGSYVDYLYQTVDDLEEPFASERFSLVETPTVRKVLRRDPVAKSKLADLWQLRGPLKFFADLYQDEILPRDSLYVAHARASVLPDINPYRSMRLSRGTLPGPHCSWALDRNSTLKSRTVRVLNHERLHAQSTPQLRSTFSKHKQTFSRKRLKQQRTWSQRSIGMTQMWATADLGVLEAKYPHLKSVRSGVSMVSDELRVEPLEATAQKDFLQTLVAERHNSHTTHSRKYVLRQSLHPNWDFRHQRPRKHGSRSRPQTGGNVEGELLKQEVARQIEEGELDGEYVVNDDDDDDDVEDEDEQHYRQQQKPVPNLNIRRSVDPRRNQEAYRRASMMPIYQQRSSGLRALGDTASGKDVHVAVHVKPFVGAHTESLCRIEPRLLDWHEKKKKKKKKKTGTTKPRRVVTMPVVQQQKR